MRLLIALVVLVAYLALSATVVENKPVAASGGNDIEIFFSADQFDAEGYVDSIWESRVIPYMTEKAADLNTLRDALQANPNAAGEQYGYRAVAEHNPYNFSVKGRVKILSANVKSRNGRLEADVQPYDGIADAIIQVGPIFRGTAIRDMLDFVNFDDFKNQVEFAKLAAELNNQVHATVIEPAGLPGDGAVGREFDMIAATTYDSNSTTFNVVPVLFTPVAE